MQLDQSFEVPFGADAVWSWFHDIEAVVECLPGASLRAPPDNDALQLSMVIKLGPITANFVGDGEVRFDETTRSGTVSGAAADRKSASRIKGNVAFALSELPVAEAVSTRVALVIDYTMGGALAQFSREGIVRDLAQRLTDTFALNLRKKLEASQPLAAAVDPIATHTLSLDEAPHAAPVHAANTPAFEAAAPAASLNVGALLWAALVDRIRRMFGARPRR